MGFVTPSDHCALLGFCVHLIFLRWFSSRLLVFIVCTFFFCFVLMLPSQRRNRWKQAMGGRSEENELAIDNQQERNMCQSCDENSSKSDGVVLRVLPDYGEVIEFFLYRHQPSPSTLARLFKVLPSRKICVLVRQLPFPLGPDLGNGRCLTNN